MTDFELSQASCERIMTDSASIRFTVAHVPGYSSLGLDREPAFIRTCARLRWRAHEGITPGLNRTRTPPAIQSTAVSPENLGSVVAAVPPFGMRRLAARTLERSGPNTVGARALAAAFISLCGGHRWLISNFSRSIMAAGKPAFLPLVQFLQEPASGILKAFVFPPVPLLSALHVRNMQQRNVQDHGKSHHNHG